NASLAINVKQLGPARQLIQMESWSDGFSGLIYEATADSIVALKTRQAGPLSSMIVLSIHLLCWGSTWLALRLAARLMGKLRRTSNTRIFAASIIMLLTAQLLSAQTVQHAEKFPGADAGEKIGRCIAALPPQGGICDARELSGRQSASAGFTVGEPAKPVQLMLGPITLATAGTIHVQAKSSMTGMPAAMGIGTDQPPSVIKAADNTALNAVVRLDGAMAVLQDLTVDGNKKGAPKGGVAIFVNMANRVEMFRVTAQNAPTHGIQFYSTDKTESCCAKLSKIMSIANGQAGLHLANTADVIIGLSEFENNGTF